MSAPRHSGTSRTAAAALVAGSLAGASLAETPPVVGLTLDGMSYVLSQGDSVELQVVARHAEVSPGSHRAALTGVHALIASPPGSPQGAGRLELVCEHGEIDLVAREFVAIGSVAGRTPDGRTLRTDRLRYRQASGVVSSDAPVSVSDAGIEYRGGGFEYWVREDRFRLSGGASIQQGE